MQNPSKIDQKSIQNRSKIYPKSRKSDFERSWRFHGKGPGLQKRFLIDFGRQHGAKLGPSWGQVGFRIASILAWCFEASSGVDFGASWVRFWRTFGSKMQPKNQLNIRDVETAKFDSRIDGSSIFDVPRGEETMKNRCQNHVNIELQLDSNLGPILERFWEPCWAPSRGQEASKTAWTFYWNLNGFWSI